MHRWIRRYFPLVSATWLAAATVGLNPAVAEPTSIPEKNALTNVAALADLSSFRAIAQDTLRLVNTGELVTARTRITDLEKAWDAAEEKLRPLNREEWRTVDKALDAALTQLRADKPEMQRAVDALKTLIGFLDRTIRENGREPNATDQTWMIGGETPPLTVTRAISLAEGREAGAVVVDISFEPLGSRALYQVRTYKDGRVWDGTIDATTGRIVGEGTTTSESALDDEDKSELAGLRGAKTTLADAVAAAEQHGGGIATNAGIEQVRGLALWEITVLKDHVSRKFLVDPKTGLLVLQ